MLPRPPTLTLFPYTTLFRSLTNCLRTATPGDCSPWYPAPSGGAMSHPVSRTGRRLALAAIAASALALAAPRSEEHTSELQSLRHLVCRLLLEKKKHTQYTQRRRCPRHRLPKRRGAPATRPAQHGGAANSPSPRLDLFSVLPSSAFAFAVVDAA